MCLQLYMGLILRGVMDIVIKVSSLLCDSISSEQKQVLGEKMKDRGNILIVIIRN